MKNRNGFVSNSSSSSFVLAFRKDCTYADIQEVFKSKKDLTDDLKNEYYEDEDGEWDLLIAGAMDLLFSEKSDGLKLGDWIVSAKEYSGEELTEDLILYEILTNIKTEKFISKATS